MGPIGNNLRPKTTGAPEKGSPTPAMPLPTSRRFQYPARHKPTPADQSLSSIPLPNQSPPARRPAPLVDLCRFWSSRSVPLSVSPPPRKRSVHLSAPPARRSVPLFEHYPNGPAPPSVHRSAKVNQFQRSFPTPPTVNTQEVCPFVGPVNTQEVCPSTRKRSVHLLPPSICCPPRKRSVHLSVPPPEGLSLCPNTPPKVCPFVRRRTCPFVRTLPQKASPTIRSSFRKGEPIPTTLSNSPDSQHSRGLSLCWPPARRSVPLLVSQEVCPFVGFSSVKMTMPLPWARGWLSGQAPGVSCDLVNSR